MVSLLRDKTIRYGRLLKRGVGKLSRTRLMLATRVQRRKADRELAESILTRYRETFEILGRE